MPDRLRSLPKPETPRIRKIEAEKMGPAGWAAQKTERRTWDRKWPGNRRAGRPPGSPEDPGRRKTPGVQPCRPRGQIPGFFGLPGPKTGENFPGKNLPRSNLVTPSSPGRRGFVAAAGGGRGGPRGRCCPGRGRPEKTKSLSEATKSAGNATNS